MSPATLTLTARHARFACACACRRCVAKPQAKIVVGVPTDEPRNSSSWRHADQTFGPEGIQSNTHRVYGVVRYPYLMTNWRLIKHNPYGGPVGGQRALLFERLDNAPVRA